jgi:hypothetical protein
LEELRHASGNMATGHCIGFLSGPALSVAVCGGPPSSDPNSRAPGGPDLLLYDIDTFFSMMETRADELNCVTTPQTNNIATELPQTRLFGAKRAPIADGCPNFECKVASVPTGPIFLAWLNHVSQYTGVGIMRSEKLDFATAEFRPRLQPISKPFRASHPYFGRGRNTELFGKRYKALVPDGQTLPAPIT